MLPATTPAATIALQRTLPGVYEGSPAPQHSAHNALWI
jgi:hypothetical protein